MKKAVSLMMAAAMTMGLAACGSSASTDTAASTADATSTTEAAESTADSAAAADGKVYNVGICQLVQHEALDAATQGFKDALVEKLGEGNVKFDEQNASGDSANCATIVNGFVSNGVDLILANATAPLQAAAQATADIPVLGTSITDYATALDISDWTGTVGNNISGTSDLAPLDQQAAMIKELFPDAKSVGLLYCSAEPNSVYQCDVIEGYLTEEGYTVARYAFTDTNDVTSVAQSAADNSDVIYIPTDNTAASNTEATPMSCCPRRFLLWLVRKASVLAAVLPHCPSATTIWATPPVRWPLRFWPRVLTSPPCRSSSPPTSPRNTTPPTAKPSASRRRTTTWPSADNRNSD